MATCVTALTAENELKQAFAQDKNDLQDIYVTYDAVNNDVIACFQPQSKSQQKIALLKSDGTAGTTHLCVFTNGYLPAQVTTATGASGVHRHTPNLPRD